ncbi:ABC transporter substrate-binding protein [Xinfangfangia sp. D13-10-4-6]|uniref:extracellular solute-binding protein n=1 Tax=Pseudogemmobacter hezensis TaxID=2737662 RepID=UPI0015570F84|nr:extracellular solute-binding protein [Pseudogemmobacter hezensis]NPD15659.1 ABC transporter substrate-binding protein [Pseudogemmobacter hezensis]
MLIQIRRKLTGHRLAPVIVLIAGLSPLPAKTEPSHGIAMYGAPALPPDFVSLPQTNPEAPKGGSITLALPGTFDSLNPFITAGNPATGITPLVVETLMGRNYDEPFSLYGLLAESVDTDSARSYVEFTLREEARFADGSPVTPEDVLWSFETLGTLGNPRYHAAWAKVASAEKSGPRSVRFTFTTADRELPLILGLRPVLQKAQWQGRDFTATSFDPPMGSGPYTVARVERGTSITYRRNPDWWGRDLPFNRGQWNLDEIRYEYFANPLAIFESFRSGFVTSYRETNPARWASSYDFPAIRSGDITLSEIPHHRPSGIEGFVFNTRNPLFQDWRVREALIQAFDFTFINQVINGGVQPRIESYFSNSPLGMIPGTPAEGDELARLLPFADSLPPGTIEGYRLPGASDATSYRRQLRSAARLLEEAGWHADDSGMLRDSAGRPFRFEILLGVGQDEMIAVAAIWIEALRALGIEASVNAIDAAQMRERTREYRFDVTHYIRSTSLSPGNEMLLYWGSAGVTQPGSGNWMGVDTPAVDALIAQILGTDDPAEFQTSVRALDRVLTAGRYVVPIWYSDRARIAHRKELKYPAKIPLYGDWLGFQPDTWWYQAE